MDQKDKWRERSACRGYDTNLWFPGEFFGTTEDGVQRRETPKLYGIARQICRTECPVQQDCLEYALEAREGYGMWGGLTRPERTALLGQRRRDARA